LVPVAPPDKLTVPNPVDNADICSPSQSYILFYRFQ
jgi:hypothetical protein